MLLDKPISISPHSLEILPPGIGKGQKEYRLQTNVPINTPFHNKLINSLFPFFRVLTYELHISTRHSRSTASFALFAILLGSGMNNLARCKVPFRPSPRLLITLRFCPSGSSRYSWVDETMQVLVLREKYIL